MDSSLTFLTRNLELHFPHLSLMSSFWEEGGYCSRVAPTEGGSSSCWYQQCPRLSSSPQMVLLALRGLLGRAAGLLPVSQVGEAQRGTVNVEDTISAPSPIP